MLSDILKFKGSFSDLDGLDTPAHGDGANTRVDDREVRISAVKHLGDKRILVAYLSHCLL